MNGLASTPYNVAVGGTDFDGLLSGFTNYVEPRIPVARPLTIARNEMPSRSRWNDSVITDGLISANAAFIDSNGNSNIVAGSGGPSSCTMNSTASSVLGVCAGGYPKPAWQRGTNVPADGARDCPTSL